MNKKLYSPPQYIYKKIDFNNYISYTIYNFNVTKYLKIMHM